MYLSVVIPTCNRSDLLVACLDRLAPGAQTLAASNYEVIVSDDGASDRQAEAVLKDGYAWATWTAGPRRGPAANRNHGASKVRGEVVVFLDDDCLPDPALLEAYQREFSDDPSLSAAEGQIVSDRKAMRLDEVAPINVTGGLFWSCNVAMRTSVFRKLGGFDERFPHAVMEDVELRCRLRRSAASLKFVPAASVVHPMRRLVGGWTSIQRMARAHGLYVRLESADLRPFTFNYAVQRFARSWLKGILPEFWRTRGAGFWVRAQTTLLPFLCVREMRRGVALPRLPSWDGNPALLEDPTLNLGGSKR